MPAEDRAVLIKVMSPLTFKQKLYFGDKVFWFNGQENIRVLHASCPLNVEFNYVRCMSSALIAIYDSASSFDAAK